MTYSIQMNIAKNEKDELIDIKSAKNNEKIFKKQKYRCIECNEKIIPKLGKIKQHHFSHLGNRSCNGETYQHKYGKYLIKEHITKCKFIPCNLCEKEITFKNSNTVKCIEELKYDNFRLDLMIKENNNDVICIEVLNTSKVSEDKLNFFNHSRVDLCEIKASEIIEKLVYNRNNIIDFKNENLKYACIKCQEILKCVKEIHPECIDIETQFEMKKDIFEIVKKFNSNIIDNKEILDKYKFLKYETFKRYNNISKSSIIKFCENYECKCGIAYQNLCNCSSRKIITKFNKKMCENCDKWICRC